MICHFASWCHLAQPQIKTAAISYINKALTLVQAVNRIRLY